MPDGSRADGPARCPNCERPVDALRRCWWCHDRPCVAPGCDRTTGSAFLERCLPCSADERRQCERPHRAFLPDGPGEEPGPPQRWVLVLEAESGTVPTSVRVKQVIKNAKKRHGLPATAFPMLPEGTRTDQPVEG